MSVGIEPAPNPTRVRRNIEAYREEEPRLARNMGLGGRNHREYNTRVYVTSPGILERMTGQKGARGAESHPRNGNNDIIIADDSEETVFHELDHNLFDSYFAELVNQEDSQESNLFNLLHEMFTTYGRYKHYKKEGRDYEAENLRKAVEKRMPSYYKMAFDIAERIDQVYESSINNRRAEEGGFESMLRDMQDMEDIKYGFRRWGQIENQIRNNKRGEDIIYITLSPYSLYPEFEDAA